MKPHDLKQAARILAILLSASSIISSPAEPITQNQASGEINVLGYAPVGQTFTAAFEQIGTIGFLIRNSSHADPGGNDFRYDLLLGAGTSGALVASTEFTLPEGFSGFAHAGFSAATLTAGQQYTVLITAPDYDWVVSWNQVADDHGPIPGRIDYAGGTAILMGSFLPNNDLTFQVQPIPEPPTSVLALLMAACCCLQFHSTRRGTGSRRR